MTDSVEHAITTRLLRGLHIAMLMVVSVILLGLDLPKLLTPSLPFAVLPVRLVFFLAVVAVVLADALLIVGNREWGRGVWAAMTLVFASYVCFNFMQPPGPLLSSDNWYFDVIGWLGVLLLFHRPLAWFGIFLLCSVVATAAPAVVKGTADNAGLLNLAVTVASVGGFQVCALAGAGALRRVAGTATAAANAAEQTRTAEAVATQLHADRRRRYQDMAVTAQPLLRGLAEGTLDPSDPGVQRRCMIEASRMRRLFAENDDNVDHLLHEIRAAIDVAERRGLQVQLITDGHVGELPREVRRALTDAPIRALSSACGVARVVVAGTDALVSVSVLADYETRIETGVGAEGVRVMSMSDGAHQWIEASWHVSRSPQ